MLIRKRLPGWALFLLVLTGCSPSAKVIDAGDPKNLRTLAAAYTRATKNQDRAPAHPAELKPFLPEGEDLDGLLISPNDGQPFVILWGTDSRPGSGDGPSPRVIGYEKVGQNGRRFVFLDMGVVQMTDAEFAKANFPAGHRPE